MPQPDGEVDTLLQEVEVREGEDVRETLIVPLRLTVGLRVTEGHTLREGVPVPCDVALALREPDKEGQPEGETEGEGEKEGEAEALGEPVMEGDPEMLTRPTLAEARGVEVLEDDTLRDRVGLDVALGHTVPLRERVAQDVALRERVTLTETDSVSVATADSADEALKVTVAVLVPVGVAVEVSVVCSRRAAARAGNIAPAVNTSKQETNRSSSFIVVQALKGMVRARNIFNHNVMCVVNLQTTPVMCVERLA